MGKFKFDKAAVIAMCSILAKDDVVQLVGDHGVYIMSFADKSMPKRKVVYAEGCNPDVDEDFYDAKVDGYGGDDGCDDIGTAGELLRIANVSGKWIVVSLTATQIKVSSDGITAAPKVDASLLPPELRKFVK